MVDLDKNIDMNDVQANCRVALRNDSYKLHKILPNKVGYMDVHACVILLINFYKTRVSQKSRPLLTRRSTLL